jgi:hypothetical protein
MMPSDLGTWYVICVRMRVLLCVCACVCVMYACMFVCVRIHLYKQVETGNAHGFMPMREAYIHKSHTYMHTQRRLSKTTHTTVEHIYIHTCIHAYTTQIEQSNTHNGMPMQDSGGLPPPDAAPQLR